MGVHLQSIGILLVVRRWRGTTLRRVHATGTPRGSSVKPRSCEIACWSMIFFRPGFARRSVEPDDDRSGGFRAGEKPVPTPHQMRGRHFRDHSLAAAALLAVAACAPAR